jgi:hypothetical protein
VAGTLLDAHTAAGAKIELDLVTLAGAELDDRVFRTGGVAIVAFEAIAAGKATLGFVQRFFLAQATNDLVETLSPLRG